MNKMDRFSIYGIICIIFGTSDLIYCLSDYEYRIYAYRYLPSLCPAGSGCPYPGLDDNLAFLGIVIITVGVILLSYGKIKHRVKN